MLGRNPKTAGDRAQYPAGDRPKNRRAAFTRYLGSVTSLKRQKIQEVTQHASLLRQFRK